MLKCFVLSSILLVAFGGAAAAKNTVLHCGGYQVGDCHRLTDQVGGPAPTGDLDGYARGSWTERIET